MSIFKKRPDQIIVVKVTIRRYCMCAYFSGIHIFSGISAESSAIILEYANMLLNNEL